MNRGAVVDFKPAAGAIAVQVSFGIGRRTVHEVSPFPQDPALDRLIAGPRSQADDFDLASAQKNG
jgi:hypothetical protein